MTINLGLNLSGRPERSIEITTMEYAALMHAVKNTYFPKHLENAAYNVFQKLQDIAKP